MKYSKAVKVWLFIGLVCVFIQVIVGGITRLTESGLSITEWEPISGALPPMNDQDWIKEFELYKQTPQYEEINEGMDLADFKFIYFWEFIHRQWARVMGLIFLFPFLFFLLRRQIDGILLRKLGLVIGLAVLAATFGWIMVASGLIQRPWVNAYKLSLHLCIAFCVFVSLLYAFLHTKKDQFSSSKVVISKRLFLSFIAIFWIQLFLGGMMSGMRIGVIYPTWPDMNGEFIPQVLFNNSLWNVESFYNYDQNELLPALTHLAHRSFAYIVFIIGQLISYKILSQAKGMLKKCGYVLSAMLILQVLIGILTVINCIGEIPISWGVIHQAGALALLTIVYVTYYTQYNLNYEDKIGF